MNLSTDDVLLMMCATLLLANFIILVGRVIAIFKVKKLFEMMLRNPEIVKSFNVKEIKDDDNELD